MSDEFDDAVDPLARISAPSPAARRGRAARLLARLYGSANAPMRRRLVACLVRPLGPLGLAAVAAGAFSAAISRSGAGGLRVAIGDVARFSNEQIAELARFVEQVSPEAMQQAARLVAENPFGIGAFSASVAVLLALELHRPARDEAPRSAGDQAAAATYPRGIAARRRRV